MNRNLNPATDEFSAILNQLEKDFSLSGWPFPDHLRHENYSQLWLDEFGLVLRKEFYREKSKLFQLLYRIDIGEKELANAALIKDIESVTEKTFVIFAELIFLREQIKVHYRMKNK
jgi:hypothetical protein